jgi:flagellar hook-associated protein 2
MLRVTGMASGMDIDKIVGDLMKARRIPLDKLNQNRQLLEWKRESYRDLNTKLDDFRNSKLFNFKLESTLQAKKAEVSGDPAAVSAKTTGASQAGSFTIKVTQLAEAATKISEGTIATTSLVTSNTLDTEATASNLTIGGTNPWASGIYKFKINDKEIEVNTATDSLDSVIDKINKQTTVTAFYDKNTQKMSFVAKNTGLTNGAANAADIQFQHVSSPAGAPEFLKDILHVTTGNTAVAPATANATQAQDAALEINGLATTRTSNTFSVNGTEITLKAITGATAATVTVKTDADKVVDSIKQFITDYNDVLKSMQDAVNEKPYRSFRPLSDEQKKDMKETDIKLWEDKAKSGLLINDSVLSKAINELRTHVASQVQTGIPNSKYNTLSSMGIETGAYQENGKLYLKDEKKLRDAIDADPAAVTAIFTANGGVDRKAPDVGILERMYDTLEGTLKDIKKKIGTAVLTNDGSIIGDDLYQLNNRINDANQKMSKYEERYYRQFQAMESAINRLNQQSAQIAGFGG